MWQHNKKSRIGLSVLIGTWICLRKHQLEGIINSNPIKSLQLNLRTEVKILQRGVVKRGTVLSREGHLGASRSYHDVPWDLLGAWNWRKWAQKRMKVSEQARSWPNRSTTFPRTHGVPTSPTSTPTRIAPSSRTPRWRTMTFSRTWFSHSNT